MKLANNSQDEVSQNVQRILSGFSQQETVLSLAFVLSQSLYLSLSLSAPLIPCNCSAPVNSVVRRRICIPF